MGAQEGDGAFLPCDVIYRPKAGFGAPLRHWLRHELREWVGDILSGARCEIWYQGFIDKGSRNGHSEWVI